LQKNIQVGKPCVHCGEDCGNNPVMFDDKAFCCHGCKTVYQLLEHKEMKQYYEFEKMPGIKVETADVGDKFAFLEIDEVREKLLIFSDGGVSKVKLFIPVIHCASCIWLLENLDTLNPAIVNSQVNFPKKEVSITFKDDQISLRSVVEMLASIHYVPEITLEDMEDKPTSKSNKSMLLKLGIAGFVFLNVMMYNFPEYVPGGEDLEANFKSFFGWLSLILSLPVVFYSGIDYFLSAIKGFKSKVISIDIPIALGILTLFLQSAYDIITGAGIGYLDSLAGLIFFLLIGKWYQGKTYQALSFERDYKSFFPIAVTKIEDEKETVVQIKDLKQGDHILVRNQELIPTDAKIIKGSGSIDYSFVTGESFPTEKSMGDSIFAGGRQIGSVIELEVLKEVEQSYLTQLWNQENSAEKKITRLNDTINKISEYFTAAILTIAIGAGIYWLINDKSIALFAFTSVLIIACPCALALTVPFTFGSTMRQFGRRGFYLKKTDTIEQLHKINTIVFDKTGTITQSKGMHIEFHGKSLNDGETKIIKSLVRHSTHPLSTSLFKFLPGDDFFEVEEYQEIAGLGITGIINGYKVNIGSKKFVTGKEVPDQAFKSEVFVFINGSIKGSYKISNQYRKGLDDVIGSLKKRFQLHLLTGDNNAEEENLKKIFPQDSQINFDQQPKDKLNYIEELKENNNKVLMVGDGLNDPGL